MSQRTITAQRRLREALVRLQRETPGGITGLRLGIPNAIQLSEQEGLPHLADVWRRLDELAASIATDLKGVTHG